MAITENRTDLAVDETTLAFVERFTEEARHAFHVLRAGGTLTANGTFFVVQRVPGHADRYVTLGDPGPWDTGGVLHPSVRDEAGTLYLGGRRSTPSVSSRSWPATRS